MLFFCLYCWNIFIHYSQFPKNIFDFSVIIITKVIRINKSFGSGALSGKILLVRIIENDKIDAYFRSG